MDGVKEKEPIRIFSDWKAARATLSDEEFSGIGIPVKGGEVYLVSPEARAEAMRRIEAKKGTDLHKGEYPILLVAAYHAMLDEGWQPPENQA